MQDDSFDVIAQLILGTSLILLHTWAKLLE
jgi:hypothetical protein